MVAEQSEFDCAASRNQPQSVGPTDRLETVGSHVQGQFGGGGDHRYRAGLVVGETYPSTLHRRDAVGVGDE